MRKFYRFSGLFFVLIAVAAPSKPFAKLGREERSLYVGKNSSEAKMKFSFRVDTSGVGRLSEDAKRDLIENQLAHLFGPMGEADHKGVPKGDHKIKITKSTASSIFYDYEGTIVVENGAGNQYEVKLPFNPKTIYKSGIVGRNKPCTDHHYQSEGDFWYFWNPENSGCPLKGQKITKVNLQSVDPQYHYGVITTDIVTSPNTTLTFPEYDRMVTKNPRTGNNEIAISVMMGMDDPDKDRNPHQSDDTNASNYVAIYNAVQKMGFSARQWSPAEIKAIAPKANQSFPWVEELVKDTPKARIVVRMFFGPSGIDEDASNFHYFFKDAIEKSAIMVYDGHSGLGGHLDLDSIENNEGFKFNIDPNRYQIYYFNSCSSYPYYNTMYFKRKGGSKNLDILTNGLATYFSVMHDTNMAVVKAVNSWAMDKGWLSYQKLVEQIDSGNLFGVNGDEDNPTSPRK